MSEQKPDGWVAWHEDVGFFSGTLATCEDDCQRYIDESYYEMPQGWDIRPVKLVFLDEEIEK
jgi:hypothetical protein